MESQTNPQALLLQALELSRQSDWYASLAADLASEAERLTSEAAQLMGQTPSGDASSKILIVDDDDATAQTFARVLRLYGYQVRTATSAAQGLREAGAHRPDVILLDLHMPLTDGLELLRQLRSATENQHTPVAIITGDYLLDDGTSIEIARLGAEIRYKPLWDEDLIGLTRTLLLQPH
jgi:CheY-like chemotaxis protein